MTHSWVLLFLYISTSINFINSGEIKKEIEGAKPKEGAKTKTNVIGGIKGLIK